MAQEIKKEKAKESKELIVKRENFAEDGEARYAYFIEAEFRGQKQRISLAPQDNGAYSLLNIIYLDTDVAKARIVEGTYRPDEDSEPVVTLSVEVYVVDGIEYTCPLKPQRNSDKACLSNLLKLLNASKVA